MKSNEEGDQTMKNLEMEEDFEKEKYRNGKKNSEIPI